jgi:hypothetical protein
MLKRPAVLSMSALFLLGAAATLFAQTLPVSGALDKTDWSLKKTGLVAFLPAAAQDSAEVTADQVAWAVTDLKRGLLSDGGRLFFNQAGALYRVSVVRIYNLEAENTAQTFKDFIASTADGYVKKLGKADKDESKTIPGAGSELSYGTLVWEADSRRAVAPTLKIEITFFASGTFVFYTEACTNTAVSAK